MTNASNENQTALAAASAVAVGDYNAQVGLVNAGSQSVQSVSQAVSSMSNINAPKTESPFTTFMNSMTKLGTSYINSPFQIQ
jgi:arabinogalactan endo-1,4-beta-galactosidase